MRALMSLVVVLGVLIVAGLGVIGVTIARRMGGPPITPAIAVPEPDGTRIASMTAAGDRLAVLLQGGGPDRVLLIDPRTGQVTGRMGLAR